MKRWYDVLTDLIEPEVYEEFPDVKETILELKRDLEAEEKEGAE
jgi:hypothetical protein